MGDAPPDLATTTAGDATDASLVILRWVHPAPERVTVLTQGAVVLGRDPSCATELESSRVSRRHAEVRWDARGVVVCDLGSRNGVFLNGERREKAPLFVGDVLRLGEFIAVVEAVSPAGLAGACELGFGITGGFVMRGVLERALAAGAAGDVLFAGEPGVGKELVARALHRACQRQGAFVVLDASAGGERAFSAELVGWTCGAGPADGASGCGALRAALGGTLLLRDVEALSLEAQRELAMLLERRTFTPLGAREALRFEGSIVLSTALPGNALAGRLSPDLHARFTGAVLEIPPLRERRADVIPLFLKRLQRLGAPAELKLEPEFLERLCLQAWPLNLDELQNVAQRLLLAWPDARELGERHWRELAPLPLPALDVDEAPGAGPGPRRSASAYPPDEISVLKAALERHRGNLTKAAEELGITRPRAYRMLKSAEAKD